MQDGKAGKTRWLRRDGSAGTLSVVLCVLLSSLMCRVRLHDVHAPFALAVLLASQLASIDPIWSLAGILLGTLIGSPPLWSTVACAAVYWIATRICLLFQKKLQPPIRILLFSLCGLCTLPVALVYDPIELLYGAISLAAALGAGLLLRILFTTVKTWKRNRVLTDGEQASCVFALGLLLLSVSDLTIVGFSFAVIVIVFATQIAVNLRSVFGVAAGALLTGLLCLYTGCDALLVAGIALGSILAVPFRTRARICAVGAFFLSGLLFFTFFQESAHQLNAQNLIMGSLLYLLLPQRWKSVLLVRTDAEKAQRAHDRRALSRMQKQTAEELERVGVLISGLGGMFDRPLEETDATQRWTVQGALTICSGCEVRRLCWKDGEAMHACIMELAEKLNGGARVVPQPPIDASCRHFTDLAASILLSYQQALTKTAMASRAAEHGAFANRQFCGAGEAIEALAARVRTGDWTEDDASDRVWNHLTAVGLPVLAVDVLQTNGVAELRVTVAQKSGVKKRLVLHETQKAFGAPLRLVDAEERDGLLLLSFEDDATLHTEMQVAEAGLNGGVNGDATGACQLAGGMAYYALSDGMGNGAAARRESEAALELLFRLCRAGVRKELIYENVNRMLLLKGDREMYATLDAVSVDLNTGEAELLKYGAPPSYLLRDGHVRQLAGEALPCGILDEAKPFVIRTKLKPNDHLILCSDGVQDTLADEMEAVVRSCIKTQDDLANSLLQLAKAKGQRDDMTVVVIRVA